MKTLLLAVGFSLLISGCGVESDAKKAVLGRLTDPDSAKFGKFTQVKEKGACLTVNARNKMGGYTGDQQAGLIKADKEWVVLGIHETSHDICITSIRDVLEPRYTAFKDCLDCPDMVVIPPGSFDMGSNNGDPSQKPVHRVTISRAFAIGKTEVTQGQWKAIMGTNPSWFSNCGDTCPVEHVSWNDAQEFIQKLNARTGKQYRLPTEAEWEYACYGGSQSEYCGGNDLDAVGWYGGSYMNPPTGNGGDKTHPTGQKQANTFNLYDTNALGLYDMSGNVAEWVEDSYHADYNGAPADGSAWQGDGAQRVLRGGSWYYDPRLGRAASRYRYVPAFRFSSFGFRLARTLS